jgi:hypothetical protein
MLTAPRHPTPAHPVENLICLSFDLPMKQEMNASNHAKR